MSVRTSVLSLAAVLILGSGVFAQDGQPAEEGKEVIVPGPVKRERRERPRFKEIGRADPGLVADDMATRLALDESQKAQVIQMVANFQALQKDLRQKYRPSDESMQRLHGIREEMKAAQETKDEAKMTALLDELKAIRAKNDELMRPLSEQIEAAKAELHTNLEGLMRGEQRQKFAAYWEMYGGDRNRKLSMAARSPQALKALVERLPGLSSRQKNDIDAVFKAYFESSKQNRRVGREADAAVKKLYDDVAALLTEEQKTKLEQQMGGGRGPGGREKPGAPAAEAAKGDAPKDGAAGGEATKTEPPSSGG
ncbi:MAG: hypothetical protein HBSAPP02_24500 [Phycisphaerae bacterium]|nr:MAG: hypothetical protein HRU71_14560 [Planctomycetia bacterium]RIK71157.1 MAG: hypothetical protein DCC66_03060 [Planctomycetota bacterium]GJQ27418.1 MAG: hypothetical protein HBSAPP02_24500 [Phycisphaerae bacterium]